MTRKPLAVILVQMLKFGGINVKLSIRGRVLRLAFSGILAALLAVGLAAFWGLQGARETMEGQVSEVGSYLTDKVGGYAEQHAIERLRQVTEAKARHLDRELSGVADDVEYLSRVMSHILQHPEEYKPRSLTRAEQAADIAPGTPYSFYSPRLRQQGIDESLQAEIYLAGNIADTLVPMSGFFDGYRTSLYVASGKGYFLCVDTAPGEKSIFPSEAKREEFISGYEPRERPWYKLGQEVKEPAFTETYIGADGHLNVECVMPYYDSNGFAGVAGIGYAVEDMYRAVVNEILGTSETILVLDGKGKVIFPSQKEGVMSAASDLTKLSQQEGQNLAEAVRAMTAGESGTMSVAWNDEEYYLTFAPVKSVGWSLGILVDKDEVMIPVEEVSSAVSGEMSSFRQEIEQDFVGSYLRAGLLLLPAALLIFYASGHMAARMVRPIRRLAAGVREISAGNFDHKLDIRTGDEIEELAAAFNDMTGTLRDYMGRLERTAAEQERARTELEVAARIQEDMLPNAFPAFPERTDFEIYASMDAARDVGGDFYDFYLWDASHLVVVIADVSGKGVPAALFMAKSQSVLKNAMLAARTPEHLAEVMEEANVQLCRNNEAAMFVTVFMGVLDLTTGDFIYADGGHCPPLLSRGGQYDFLPMEKHCVLGLMEMPYGQDKVNLSPGDTLFLYTDGVSEAIDEAEALFTEACIKETLNRLSPEDGPEGIIRGIKAALQQHVQGAEQSDDITMLVLRYNGNGK